MKATLVNWTRLRSGDLFQTRDDTHPLRVLAVLPAGGVLVKQGFQVWKVFFRPGARVFRFS